MGLSWARDVDVLYIWEQPRSVPTSRKTAGVLHGLGGRLGGHSSLQLECGGGVVAFVHEG
jgi:hypothetical protein